MASGSANEELQRGGPSRRGIKCFWFSMVMTNILWNSLPHLLMLLQPKDDKAPVNVTSTVPISSLSEWEELYYQVIPNTLFLFLQLIGHFQKSYVFR